MIYSPLTCEGRVSGHERPEQHSVGAVGEHCAGTDAGLQPDLVADGLAYLLHALVSNLVDVKAYYSVTYHFYETSCFLQVIIKQCCY